MRISIALCLTVLLAALGSAPAMAGPGDPQPVRISFKPGASAAVFEDTVAAAGMNTYVLRAMQGQTMWVSLNAISGAAILVIWGADGTVLISDHADATTWSGVLPTTQDYYIDVKGNVDVPSVFTLEVVIPPYLTGRTVALDASVAGGQVQLNAGDQMTITLDSNPTTGYLWEIQEVDVSILQPVGQWVFESSSDRMGAGGTETRRLVALKRGATPLELIYHRPWERDAPPAK
jgi:inhibitor of cysteine peptidase